MRGVSASSRALLPASLYLTHQVLSGGPKKIDGSIQRSFDLDSVFSTRAQFIADGGLQRHMPFAITHEATGGFEWRFVDVHTCSRLNNYVSYANRTPGAQVAVAGMPLS